MSRQVFFFKNSLTTTGSSVMINTIDTSRRQQPIFPFRKPNHSSLTDKINRSRADSRTAHFRRREKHVGGLSATKGRGPAYRKLLTAVEEASLVKSHCLVVWVVKSTPLVRRWSIAKVSRWEIPRAYVWWLPLFCVCEAVLWWSGLEELFVRL